MIEKYVKNLIKNKKAFNKIYYKWISEEIIKIIYITKIKIPIIIIMITKKHILLSL